MLRLEVMSIFFALSILTMYDSLVWGDPVFPFQASYDMDRVEIKIIGNAIQGELGVKVLKYVFHNIGCQQFRGIALRLEYLYKTQEPEKNVPGIPGETKALGPGSLSADICLCSLILALKI